MTHEERDGVEAIRIALQEAMRDFPYIQKFNELMHSDLRERTIWAIENLHRELKGDE